MDGHHLTGLQVERSDADIARAGVAKMGKAGLEEPQAGRRLGKRRGRSDGQ